MTLPDYPGEFRMCKICRAPFGLHCFTRSGRIVGGRPNGVATVLLQPHKGRLRSTRKARKA